MINWFNFELTVSLMLIREDILNKLFGDERVAHEQINVQMAGSGAPEKSHQMSPDRPAHQGLQQGHSSHLSVSAFLLLFSLRSTQEFIMCTERNVLGSGL
jgi:hypothetical protein